MGKSNLAVNLNTSSDTKCIHYLRERCYIIYLANWYVSDIFFFSNTQIDNTECLVVAFMVCVLIFFF